MIPGQPLTAQHLFGRDGLLRTDEKAEGMTGGISEHIQRLVRVVSAVKDERGPQIFGALPLTVQFLDAGHTEVVMHLLRYIVRGPGRSGQGRNLLESEHSVSRRVEQDQPVRLIVAAVGHDLIAGTIPETKELPVELRETPAVGGIESGVHQDRVGGRPGPPAECITQAGPADCRDADRVAIRANPLSAGWAWEDLNLRP